MIKKIDTDKIENINIILDTALGLVQTINDLVADEESLLFQYPDNDNKEMATRLGTKLLALSNATADSIEKAESKVLYIVNQAYKDGDK